jgi:hypothetical protein
MVVRAFTDGSGVDTGGWSEFLNGEFCLNKDRRSHFIFLNARTMNARRSQRSSDEWVAVPVARLGRGYFSIIRRGAPNMAAGRSTAACGPRDVSCRRATARISVRWRSIARPVLVAVGRKTMQLLGFASFCLHFALVQWFIFPGDVVDRSGCWQALTHNGPM